jgi:hypothetical protein
MVSCQPGSHNCFIFKVTKGREEKSQLRGVTRKMRERVGNQTDLEGGEPPGEKWRKRGAFVAGGADDPGSLICTGQRRRLL